MTNDAKSIYLLFTISIIGLMLQYGLQTYLAHCLGTQLYGNYNIIVQILTIFASVSLIGMDGGAQAFLAKYLRSNKNFALKKYLEWNVKIISTSLLISRLLAAISFVTITMLHLLGTISIYEQPILFYALWATPFAAIFRLTTSILISSNRVLQSFILTNAVTFVVQFAFFFIASSVFKLRLDNLGILIVLASSYFLLFLIAIIFLQKTLLNKIRDAFLNLTSTSFYNKDWSLPLAKLASNNLTYLFLIAADLIIIKLVSKNEISVSHYAAAQSIASFLWVLPGNLYLKLKPTISNAVGTIEGQHLLQQTLININRIAFVIFIGLAILLLYFSGPLLLLFGPSYIQAKPALIYLLIGGLGCSFFQPGIYILLYSYCGGFVCIASAVQLGLILVFMIPATYWFGITGAAIVKSTVWIITYLTYAFNVKKKFNINIISVKS